MQPLPLQSASARTPRMEVLDVIRGVTMILVVFHHVRGTTFGLYNSQSPLSEFLMSFRMPMFFFISGFVAYKAVDAWSWSFYGRRLWKKAMVELFPTAVFFGLFVGLTEWDWDFLADIGLLLRFSACLPYIILFQWCRATFSLDTVWCC